MELGTTINRCADWLCTDTPVARVLDNPFYTSVVLTLIIMLIVFMHVRSYSCDDDDSRTKAIGIRFATHFYVFCAIMGTLFLYHRRFDKKTRAEVRGSAIQRALSYVSSVPAQNSVAIEPVLVAERAQSSDQTLRTPIVGSFNDDFEVI